MSWLFYGAGAVALLATARAVSCAHAVHALLYLITSLLALGLVMLSLGAPFAAALVVLVYAGAIMVLFVFVVMLIDVGPESARQERAWMAPRYWRGPALLAALLLGQLLVLLLWAPEPPAAAALPPLKQLGAVFYGPWLLAVELGSFLLLAGLVAAYHLGRRD